MTILLFENDSNAADNMAVGFPFYIPNIMDLYTRGIWKYFLMGFMKDNVKYRTTFLQGITGVERPARKRYSVLSDRILRALETYGQTDFIKYLSALNHLSFR